MLKLTQAPRRPLVAASILAADFGAMATECRSVLDGGADLLHLDVMDGHFVPNLTMGPDMCRALRSHFPDAYLDVHLMVEDPHRFIEPFAEAGANLLSFHLEALGPGNRPGHEAGHLIERIHACRLDAGLALNPPTDVESVEGWLGDLDLELVLVMSVNPGRAGQRFRPEVLPKAQRLKRLLATRTRLQMDGGLNRQTADGAVAAGADVLVTASALFGTAPTQRRTFIDALHQLEIGPA